MTGRFLGAQANSARVNIVLLARVAHELDHGRLHVAAQTCDCTNRRSGRAGF